MTEAQKEAVCIADRVIDRVARGVPAGREMSQAEIRPVLAALATWKAAAFAANDALQDAKGRALD